MKDSSTLQESCCSKEFYPKGSYLKDLKFLFLFRLSLLLGFACALFFVELKHQNKKKYHFLSINWSYQNCSMFLIMNDREKLH